MLQYKLYVFVLLTHQAHPALEATLQLLPSAWALTSGCRSSGSRAISEEVLLALGDMSWLTTALLWGLQCPDALSGVWVGTLCKVQYNMLPGHISQVPAVFMKRASNYLWIW